MKRLFKGPLIAAVAAFVMTACATPSTTNSQGERLALVTSEADGNVVVV
jgi:uncharacterized lipoprotein YajG